MMMPMAQGLSKQDIKHVAAYYSSLKGDLRVKWTAPLSQLAANAIQISLFIRRGVITLRPPYRFSQTFQQQVQRIVLRVRVRQKLRVQAADSARLIDRDLLGESKMQRQMQKGIELAAFGKEIAVDIALFALQQRVILRVQQHYFKRGFFQPFQRCLRAVLAPSFEEETAHVFARRIKHEGKYAVSSMIPSGDK